MVGGTHLNVDVLELSVLLSAVIWPLVVELTSECTCMSQQMHPLRPTFSFCGGGGLVLPLGRGLQGVRTSPDKMNAVRAHL